MAETIEVHEDGSVTIHREASKYVRSLPSYGLWLKFLEARGHAVPCTRYAVELDGKRQGIRESAADAKVLARAYGERAQVVPVSTLKTAEHSLGVMLLDGRVGIPCILCGELTCPICGTPGMTEAEECCSSRNHSLLPEERAEANSLLSGRKLSAMGRSAVRLSLRRVASGMTKIHVGTMVKMRAEDVTGEQEVTIKQIPKPVSKSGLACTHCQGVHLKAMEAMNVTNQEREVYNLEIAKLILADEHTVYHAALTAALSKLSEVEGRKIAMTVLKAHQKGVAKQLGPKGATKSMLTHPTIEVKDAVLGMMEQGEGA